MNRDVKDFLIVTGVTLLLIYIGVRTWDYVPNSPNIYGVVE